MVHPGGLYLFIYAPLYPLYKSLSNRSYLGNKRRQGESRDPSWGKDQILPSGARTAEAHEKENQMSIVFWGD